MYFRTETYMYVVEMLILPKCSVCTCILVTSQFAYLELRITRNSFSVPLDFDISRLHCIKIIIFFNKFSGETTWPVLTKFYVDPTVKQD